MKTRSHKKTQKCRNHKIRLIFHWFYVSNYNATMYVLGFVLPRALNAPQIRVVWRQPSTLRTLNPKNPKS